MKFHIYDWAGNLMPWSDGYETVNDADDALSDRIRVQLGYDVDDKTYYDEIGEYEVRESDETWPQNRRYLDPFDPRALT